MTIKTLIIWNENWDDESWSPYQQLIYHNQNQAPQEIKIISIELAATSLIEDSDEPTNLVSIVLQKDGEDLFLPFPEVDNDNHINNHIKLFNNSRLLYSSFFDLDSSVEDDSPNVKIRLNQNDKLHFIITPWTPPSQNINAIIKYEIRNII